MEVEQGDRGCDFSTDFNSDGHPDIVFCGHTGVHFYQNNGDGTFTDVSVSKLGTSTFFASDVKLADVNGDGLLDMVYIRNGQEGVRLGTPSGMFASATLTHVMTFGRSLEVADVNGDGYLDIYALEGNGVPGCLTCTTNYPDYLYLGGRDHPGQGHVHAGRDREHPQPGWLRRHRECHPGQRHDRAAGRKRRQLDQGPAATLRIQRRPRRAAETVATSCRLAIRPRSGAMVSGAGEESGYSDQ